MKRNLLIALAICTVAGAASQASPPRITGTGSIDNMSKIIPVTGISTEDARFLQAAAAANWLEIKSSEMAQAKASSDWAKHFATDMLTDHKAAQTEVVQMAHDKGIDPSSNPPAMVKHMADSLMGLTGSAFDEAYRNIQIKGHKMASDALATEIKNGHDEEVRGLAVKLLPVVKMHLKMAQMRDTMTHG